MKCQARITRVFKTRKAECIWPETLSGFVPDITNYPEVCGGDVTVKLRAVTHGCSCCNTTELEAEWVCSRCRAPWVPQRFRFDQEVAGNYDGIDVTALLEAP